jgi:hypothetical protein
MKNNLLELLDDTQERILRSRFTTPALQNFTTQLTAWRVFRIKINSPDINRQLPTTTLAL